MMDRLNEGWWISRDEEHCFGPYATREEAVQVGKRDYDGDPFYVMEGRRMKLRAPDFSDWFAEAFDDLNEEYADPDGYGHADAWDDEAYGALCRSLRETADQWLAQHGYDYGWGLDLSPSELIPAQWDRSGEADETRRGSVVGESPVDGEAGDAPDPLTPSNPEIPNG